MATSVPLHLQTETDALAFLATQPTKGEIVRRRADELALIVRVIRGSSAGLNKEVCEDIICSHVLAQLNVGEPVTTEMYGELDSPPPSVRHLSTDEV